MKGIQRSQEYDVVILGAGITGIVTAIRLQQLGYSTAVIERSNLNKAKAGESLSPESKRYFNMVGFNFDEEIGIYYDGIRFKWGHNQSTTDFLFNPYGDGISVERSVLEQKLKLYGESCGTVFHLDTEVKAIDLARNYSEIAAANASEVILLKCRLIILATGRADGLKFFKNSKIYYDRLIALSMSVDYIEAGNFMEIEDLKDGWMYSNAIPGQSRVFSFFTDADLTDRDWHNTFRRTLEQMQFIREPSARNNLNDNFHVFDARTSWSTTHGGKGWLRLGENAYSIDPLSGMGILKNLRMCEFCCDNMGEFINHSDRIQEDYFQFNKSSFEQYLTEGRSIYEGGKVDKISPFWSRRGLKPIN